MRKSWLSSFNINVKRERQTSIRYRTIRYNTSFSFPRVFQNLFHQYTICINYTTYRLVLIRVAWSDYNLRVMKSVSKRFILYCLFHSGRTLMYRIIATSQQVNTAFYNSVTTRLLFMTLKLFQRTIWHYCGSSVTHNKYFFSFITFSTVTSSLAFISLSLFVNKHACRLKIYFLFVFVFSVGSGLVDLANWLTGIQTDRRKERLTDWVIDWLTVPPKDGRFSDLYRTLPLMLHCLSRRRFLS